jgi:hypothetical protein
VPAGVADADGKYPAGSLNQRIAARLDGFAAVAASLMRQATAGGAPP